MQLWREEIQTLMHVFQYEGKTRFQVWEIQIKKQGLNNQDK